MMAFCVGSNTKLCILPVDWFTALLYFLRSFNIFSFKLTPPWTKKWVVVIDAGAQSGTPFCHGRKMPKKKMWPLQFHWGNSGTI